MRGVVLIKFRRGGRGRVECIDGEKWRCGAGTTWFRLEGSCLCMGSDSGGGVEGGTGYRD